MARLKTAKSPDWWQTDGVLGKQYKFKKDLVADIRGIINPAPLNTPLPDDERDFLVDVLVHHHDWTAKRGVGIDHIEVRINPSHTGATRGLWIVRDDGSEVDVSWVVALKDGGRSTAKENVVAAARREIWDQVLEARAAQEGGPCPICGEPLVGRTHIDHAAPNTFSAILDGFLHAYGHSWDSIGVDDFGIYNLFENRALAADWQHYHAQQANLRLVHAHENLSMGARG